MTHTPSIAFRHLPPNSARFDYATDAVSAFRKVWLLIIKTVEAAYCPSTHVNMRGIHPGLKKKKKEEKGKEVHLDSNDFGLFELA